MLEWDEGDGMSFDDSERFEEDSLCSWGSEPESVCNNWRGWKKISNVNSASGVANSSNGDLPSPCVTSNSSGNNGGLLSLYELAAKKIARNIPFEVVERYSLPIPEEALLRIAFLSFPEDEEGIRLYSCLANGSADEFFRGERLIGSVRDLLQIGFHLSATVILPQEAKKGSYNVAVTFDCSKITSCDCTCSSPSSWCSHVVAVCLFRINHPDSVTLRPPITESLSRLNEVQLQKFAQYLISELPRQILPVAQRLLDELLSSPNNPINKIKGAPDPTAGASVDANTAWCLDHKQLHENIKKILNKLCIPSPIVYSDVNYLTTTAPPAAVEWTTLLRPLRGREPESMWNLLSIVREMFRRGDHNAISLLQVLTQEVLACDQIILWWFNTRASLHAGGHAYRAVHSSTHTSQYACSSLCDEIVVLWRIACLNPRLLPQDREAFFNQLALWHTQTLERVAKMRASGKNSGNSNGGNNHHHQGNNQLTNKREFEVFPGFKPAVEACLLSWSDFPISGFTDGLWLQFSYFTSDSPSESYPKFFPGLKASGINTIDQSTERAKNGSQFECAASTSKSGEASTTASQSQPEWRMHPCNITHYCKNVISSNASSNCFLSVINEVSANRCDRLSGSVDSEKCPQFGPVSVGNLTDANKKCTNSSGRKITQTSALQSHNTTNQMSPSNNISDGRKVSLDLGETSAISVPQDGQLVDGNDSLEHPSSNRSSISSVSEGFCEENISTADTSNDQLDCEGESTKPLCNECPPEASSSSGDSRGVSNVAQSTLATSSLVTNDQVTPEKTPNATPSTNSSSSSSSNSHSTFKKEVFDRAVIIPVPGLTGLYAVPNNKKNNNAQANEKFELVIRMIDDPLEILFARAEALHAHGFSKEAGKVAVQLAEEMLENPPNLPAAPNRGKSTRNFNPLSHSITLLASNTLSKAAFLCSVLSDNPEHAHLAFRIGLFGIEMTRPPASIKALEVKLSNQEQDLAILLKKLPLKFDQLQVLREKAIALRDGQLRSRGEALLPLTLASYIFDALVLSACPQRRSDHPIITGRLPTDELLGFEAAVATIGLKANVSEAEHPLLCEGTRRQRGELALSLLVHYKDDQEKLNKIMDKLLDKEVHQMFKNRASTPPKSEVENRPGPSSSSGPNECSPAAVIQMKSDSSPTECNSQVPSGGEAIASTSSDPPASPSSTSNGSVQTAIDTLADATGTMAHASTGTLSNSNSDESLESRDVPAGGLSCTYPRVTGDPVAQSSDHGANERSESASSPPCWDRDYKQWEARFRCTNLKTNKKHSVGMASIDSSAPETTSSDNSPTVVRRHIWLRNPGPTGPPSDSGTSGESSDSFVSSSSASKAKQSVPSTSGASHEVHPPVASSSKLPSEDAAALSQRVAACSVSNQPSNPQVIPSKSEEISIQPAPRPNTQLTNPVRPVINNLSKSSRFKGKRPYPSIPNQPSEASAHFMFELAKTVHSKAGGLSANTVYFAQQPNNGQRGIHRGLQMCAFQIGLYALGLHNSVSPNWLSRTYSSQVSFVNSQALEIGAPAIDFLVDTWEGHLTPNEVITLADNSSINTDHAMVKAAAKLALSCLPHAQALNPTQIQRALNICREQSHELLEQACLAVENAAKGGCVCHEVLFIVARKWYEMYEELSQSAKVSRARRQVQASVGEFQVPTANTNNQNGTMSNPPPIVSEAAAAAVANAVANATANQSQANYVLHPTNPQAAAAAAAAAFQMLPPAPQANFGLPIHPHYSYGYFTGISTSFAPQTLLQLAPAATAAACVHPSIQAPPPPANFYPNVTTAAAALVTSIPGMPRNPLQAPHSTLFPVPPMMSNVVAIAQAQNRGFQMITQPGHTLAGVPNDPSSVMAAAATAAGLMQVPQPQQPHPGTNVQAHHHNHHLMTGHHGLIHATHAPAPAQPMQQLSPRQFMLLFSSYRVGMLAMETLSRLISANYDRPHAKFARNPPYGEDVKWLLQVAKKLGKFEMILAFFTLS